MQFAQLRTSLIEIEIESARLGLVSARAIQGDNVSFSELEYASQVIQRESTSLDTRRLDGHPPWSTQSNGKSLQNDIQIVIDAREAILQNEDVAFHLKLQIDGLKSDFLKMAMNTGAIGNDAIRVFVLMNTALKLEGMSAWISVLMSNTRESELARISVSREMNFIKTDVDALIDGSKELEINAEKDADMRKMLVDAQADLKSTFEITTTLLQQTQSMRAVSEASSRIIKAADELAALARAQRNQLPNR